mmetsp:Transcript_7614/g.27873  ORF Transcript_7614/g.27873 Transcript_7614/m.27873 type:complete len:209 (-) Transcript_7614:1257-1883(-)
MSSGICVHTLNSKPFKSETDSKSDMYAASTSKHMPFCPSMKRILPHPSASLRSISVNARSKSPARIAGSVPFTSSTMYVHEFGAPVSKDLGGGASVCPLSAASAAESVFNTSVSTTSGNKRFAAGVKYGKSSSSTLASKLDAVTAHASMTSVELGMPTALNSAPVSFLMRRIMWDSRSVCMAMAAPFCPARPVRPHLCTNDSTSLGSS